VRPTGEQGMEIGRAGQVRVRVERHVHAVAPRRIDDRQQLAGSPTVHWEAEVSMRQVYGYTCEPADLNGIRVSLDRVRHGLAGLWPPDHRDVCARWAGKMQRTGSPALRRPEALLGVGATVRSFKERAGTALDSVGWTAIVSVQPV